VSRKLGLKTYRRAGNYYLAESENAKLDRLFERYGLVAETGNDTSRTSTLPESKEFRANSVGPDAGGGLL
jgi:hypothetical protein